MSNEINIKVINIMEVNDEKEIMPNLSKYFKKINKRDRGEHSKKYRN